MVETEGEGAGVSSNETLLGRRGSKGFHLPAEVPVMLQQQAIARCVDNYKGIYLSIAEVSMQVSQTFTA